VTQKSIFINTYNVYVIDLATKRVVYRHESYHLWEASIRGLLLKNYDFIILSKDGQKVMSLGYQNKRVLRDNQGTTWQLHSLDSCRDLLLEPSNNLLFTRKQNEIIMSVQEQYQIGEDTNFEDIYKVQISTMSLRDLLMFQSIFSCRQMSDIVNLIEHQPEPVVFYKSFLELEKQNLVSVLSFDSRSIKTLLSEKHEHLFVSEYPIFYKTRDIKGLKAEEDE